MCANNLREGVFDTYAIDPNTSHSRDGDFFIVNWVDPSDPSFLLPAVRCTTSLDDRPSESVLPHEEISYPAVEHDFKLMV
jgi:hypothetical protein